MAWAPAAREWLARARKPRLLHRGHEVLHLVDDASGGVLTLVPRRQGLGPFAAWVAGLEADAISLGEGVVPHARPLGSERLLQLGAPGAGLTLRLGRPGVEPELWEPRPEWERLPEGIEESESVIAGELEGELDSQLAGPWRVWLGSLESGGRAQVASAAASLAGRGSGLTPAGDDLLLGSFWALIAGAAAGDRELAAWAEAAAERTTTLAAAWLRAAARGGAPEPWHRWIASSARGDRAEAAAARSEIEAWGASSGRYALFAFHTLRALLGATNLHESRRIER